MITLLKIGGLIIIAIVAFIMLKNVLEYEKYW